MSQLILDDQLDVLEVLPALQHWITVERLRNYRPNEHILDERVPEILQTLRQPTFVTIDEDFWDRNLCHPAYAILYFALRDKQQDLLPGLLRALFHRSEFRTRTRRMGKVARISRTSIDWWQFQSADMQRDWWKGTYRLSEKPLIGRAKLLLSRIFLGFFGSAGASPSLFGQPLTDTNQTGNCFQRRTGNAAPRERKRCRPVRRLDAA